MATDQISPGRFKIGCDIGGTFTDFAIFDQVTGDLHRAKCLTTPDDPSRGVMQGLAEINGRYPGILSQTAQVFHGTTLVINAILERKGAKTALLTTEGFRDVLEIGTERRYDLYDLQQLYPQPLVPRRLRRGVRERMYADGRCGLPLEDAAVEDVVAFCREHEIQSVAICFLHSYKNDANEVALREALRRSLPDCVSISVSSEVLPEINEYIRSSTTVVNAYTQPLMDRYLDKLVCSLRAEGLRGQVLMMLSSGGLTSVETARAFPVRVIESGPVGGVTMGRHIRALAQATKALSFDMGGTTAKVSIIQDGELVRSSDYEVGRVQRFKAGSGIPVRVPCVDLLEIGTGGGSLATINSLDLLQVGPESSGAMPGPVCYGLGGTHPTVTDANLVLGYLDPRFFLGGRMALSKEASSSAIETVIAEPLELSTLEAAWGIHNSVNESMAAATKMFAVERGVDVSRLVLISSGGAGPLHSYGLALKLGIEKFLVPPAVGVASAAGFLLAPVSYEVTRTVRARLEDVSLDAVADMLSEMVADATARMGKAGETAKPQLSYSVDVRYLGQGFEISIPLPEDFRTLGKAHLEALFHERYGRLFGQVFESNTFEVVTLRLAAQGPDPEWRSWRRPTETRQKQDRPAFCPNAKSLVQFKVLDRYSLATDERIVGPAVIEEDESTTIIWTGGEAWADANGVLHVRVGSA